MAPKLAAHFVWALAPGCHLPAQLAAGKALEYPAIGKDQSHPSDPRAAAVGPIGTSAISPHWQAWRQGLLLSVAKFRTFVHDATTSMLLHLRTTLNNSARTAFYHSSFFFLTRRRRPHGRLPKTILITWPESRLLGSRAYEVLLSNTSNRPTHTLIIVLSAHSHPPGSLLWDWVADDS